MRMHSRSMPSAWAQLYRIAFSVGGLLVLSACPSGDALVCGADTVLENGACVSTRVETRCGEGTVFDASTGECRAEVDCAPGTSYDAAARVCIADASCGTGTAFDEETGQCSPTVTCGPNTVVDEDTGNCVNITQCGTGTLFDDVAGECVPVDTCGEGTQYHPLTHLCTPDVQCGPGLIATGGTCFTETQIFGMDADVSESLADDNDPAYGGVPEMVTLEPVGDALIVAGVIGRPVDRDGDDIVDQDRDAWGFNGTQGQLLRIRVLSDGLPQPAFVVHGPEGYFRASRRGVVLQPEREVLLPRGGAYTITVEPAGASEEAAPIGDPDFGYLLVVEELAFPLPIQIETSVSDTQTGQLFDLTDNVFRLDADSPRGVQWALSAPAPSDDEGTIPVLLVFDELGGPVTETVLEEDDGVYATAQGFWPTPTAPAWVVVDWVSSTGFDETFTADIAPLSTVDTAAFAGDESVFGLTDIAGESGVAFSFEGTIDEVLTVVFEGLGRPFVTIVGPLGEVTQTATLERETLTFVPPVSGTYRALAINQNKSDIRVELGLRRGVANDLGTLVEGVTQSAMGERLTVGRATPERGLVRFDLAADALVTMDFSFDEGMPDYFTYRIMPEGGLVEIRSSGEDGALRQRMLLEGPGSYLSITDPVRLFPENPDIVNWVTEVTADAAPAELETEPNDTDGAATLLGTLPALVVGEKSTEEDKDVYRLELASPLAANEELRIEVSGIETDRGIRITVRDALGDTVRSNSSLNLTRTSLLAGDGDGPFFVEIDPSEDDPHRYTLSVERTARIVLAEPDDNIADATVLMFDPAVGVTAYGRSNQGAPDFVTIVPVAPLATGETLRVRLRNDTRASDMMLAWVDGTGAELKSSKHEDARLYIPSSGVDPVHLSIVAATSSGYGYHYVLSVDTVTNVMQEPNESVPQAELITLVAGETTTRIGQDRRATNNYFRLEWADALTAGQHIRVDFAGTLERGDMQARVLDANGTLVEYVRDYRGRLLLPPTLAAPVFVNIQPDSFSATARLDAFTVQFRIEDGTVEQEPNNEAASATPMDLPLVVQGQSHVDDPDVYRIENTGVLRVGASALDESRALRVLVRDSAGATLGSVEDTRVDWVLDASEGVAPLYLEVRSTLSASAEQSPYQLNVSIVD